MSGTRPGTFPLLSGPFLFQATNLPADGGPTIMSIVGINNVPEGYYFKNPFLIKEIGFGANAAIVAGTILIRPFVDATDHSATLSVTLSSGVLHAEAEFKTGILLPVGSRLTCRYTSVTLNPASSLDIGGWVLGSFV